MRIKSKHKGSTLVLTIIFIAVMFVMSVALIEAAMSSLKISKGYYAKNRAYYDAESVFERVVYYLDMVADRARKMADNYVFMESGVLNTQNPDVADILRDYQERENQYYVQYMNGLISKTDYDSAVAAINQDYQKKVKEKFLEKFKEYMNNFFTASGSSNERPAIEFTVSGVTYTVDNWKGASNDLYSFMKMVDFNNPDVDVEIKFDPAVDMNLHMSTLDIENPIDVKMEVIVNLLKEKTKRILRVDFNIFPYKSSALNFTTRIIKRSFNHILDYTLFAGRNLIVINDSNLFSIKGGKVYVRGTANDVRYSNPSEYFGGILAGITQTQLDNLASSSRVNPIDSAVKSRIESIIGSSGIKSGNIKIESAPVFVGYTDINPNAPSTPVGLRDKYALYGGFIKTCAPNSQVAVTDEVYCHSIVTENTAGSSAITINKNAYIMDNVSMYAQNSNIEISGSLIGLGTGDTPYNYNSSSSIVINEDTAKLTIGRNIVLMGVAYVDEIHRTDETGKEKLFRMPESSSLIPNFTIYQYFNLPLADLTDLLNTLGLNGSIGAFTTADLFAPDYFKPFKVKVSPTDEVDVNLYDMDVPTVSGFTISPEERAINFVLHYLTAHVKDPDDFDTPYNMGASNITVGGGSINFNPSNPHDTSYFHYFLNANGKLYLARKILNILNEGVINSTIGPAGSGEFINLGATISSSDFLRQAVVDNVIDPTVEQFFKELNLVDKGLLDTTRDKFDLTDFVDFDQLLSDRLVINDDKNLIVISKNDVEEIDFGLPSWNGVPLGDIENVLIVSKGSIVLKNSSTTEKNLKGNIIAGGDIVIAGNGNLKIEYSRGVSSQLMYYFNYANFSSISDRLGQLYNFFIKGIDTNDIIEIPFVTTFYETTVKTNIKIKSKRQVVSD
ncbi:pilus assembly PilX N-terminal domain-containing protein [Caldicellulosiruptor acetigenus]|uniref:pilus assembly PilX N-terminal domain-containing protein n=1 Tax=Caldicellulosiruptor acetigenus TaxID=301953 RepID=UPI000421A07B|nr:pilus assembly PilX N-terminal domain-containing protein [Caldicellulosiruptor acetigenus]WAM37059.1 pilus assembly PilX N-terminal domain-containing protein [Caldicellulosiruptor acetigenus]